MIFVFILQYKVQGYVYDGKVAKPLEAVAVYLEGTPYGTYTDEKGYYEILFSGPTGKYKLNAEILGYKKSQKEIFINSNLNVDFYLEPQGYVLEEVVVKAEPEPIKKDVGFTQTTIRRTDLKYIPEVSIKNVLQNLSSITGYGNEIHVRGSRVSDVLVLVDGIPVRNPITGSISTTFIPYNAFEEIEALVGGFNPEYGEASGGVINIKTNEGYSKIQGNLRYEGGSFGRIYKDTSGLKWGFYEYNNIDLNIKGPLYRNLTYSLDISGDFDNTHLPNHFKGPYEQNNYSLMLKLGYGIKSLKFRYFYNRAIETSQGFFYSSSDYRFAYGFPIRYMFYLEGYPIFRKELVNSYFSIDYLISPVSLFELRIARVFNGLTVRSRNKMFNEYEPIEDNYPLPSGDGFFYDSGDSPYWHHNNADGWIYKVDFTRYLSAYNKLKLGFIHENYLLTYIDIHYPWYNYSNGIGLNYDIFKTYSNKGGFYIQNTTKFGGLIAVYGFRVDYWKIGEYALERVRSILEDKNYYLPPIVRNQYEKFIKEGDLRFNLSPRISISYPISENDKFYFSYGRFSKVPDLKYVYTKLGIRASSNYELVGNPNLKPTITVAYEMGFERILAKDIIAKLSAFYRDIFNYPTAIRIDNLPPNPDFWIYLNSDYSRSLGIEFQIEKKFSNNNFFSFDITISQVRGRGATSEDLYLGDYDTTISEIFMPWDRPVKLYMKYGRKFKYDIFTTITLKFQSGRRYTPVDSTGKRGEPYSKIGPPWLNLSLKLTKKINKFADAYLKIENILDYKNVYIINPITGRAYKDGDKIPPRSNIYFYKRPDMYVDPFRLNGGINVEW
ncbi:MAG: TonB-dependent receptor [candidate division WOR-3 bacterium]|nr:TonB-dependent receptor [candidate division WOR-3 bacterium]